MLTRKTEKLQEERKEGQEETEDEEVTRKIVVEAVMVKKGGKMELD